MMVRRSDVELRAGYTLTVPQLAQLLRVSDSTVRQHLVDADGNPVRLRGSDPNVPLFLSWIGELVPTRRDHNGHLMFKVSDCDAVLADRHVSSSS